MTSPYFQFGAAQRYVFQWKAGQGGVMPNVHAPASSLGAADMLESGYGDSNFIHWPAFRKVAPIPRCAPHPCGLRAQSMKQLGDLEEDLGAAIGHKGGQTLGAVVTLGPRGRHAELADWPLLRPQGFEPGWAATGAIPVWDGLTDTQKTMALVALGAGALWFLSRRKKRNPARRRNDWTVSARHKRGVTGSLVFKKKKFAMSYADDLRKSKKHSRVKVSRR